MDEQTKTNIFATLIAIGVIVVFVLMGFYFYNKEPAILTDDHDNTIQKEISTYSKDETFDRYCIFIGYDGAKINELQNPSSFSDPTFEAFACYKNNEVSYFNIDLKDVRKYLSTINKTN